MDSLFQHLKFTCRLALVMILFSSFVFSESKDWDDIVKKGKGQTVHFYAWGGLDSINQYIKWASERIEKIYGVKLKHIKTTDTALTVKQILTEKKAGTKKGSVDLVWINGENFKTMKKNNLLKKNLDAIIPNVGRIDFENNPSANLDFSEPVDGLEIPWGTAKLVFIYDKTRTPTPPGNHRDLVDFLKKNQGRFTYPAPPEFHGTTFIKQLLLEILGDKNREVLNKPVNQKQFASITQPLWNYLDSLHPLLWAGGKNFPASLGNLNQLFVDSEILLSLSFNPNFVQNQIYNEEFPSTTSTYTHDGGTIGNTHFLAIPNTSGSQEGALLAINFFISPEAQARKADIRYWGDPTVLNMKRLSQQKKEFFKDIPGGLKSVSDIQKQKTIPEPHSSWADALEKEWIKRYAN